MSDEFSLFTSIRYDVGLKKTPSSGLDHAGWNYSNESPLYMLDFHRDRLLRAATHWQWKAAIDVLSGDQAIANIASLAEEFIGAGEETPLRLRIVVGPEGSIDFAKFNTPGAPLRNLFPERLPQPGSTAGPKEPEKPLQYTLLLDNGNVARSEYTHFKTTRRAMYDAARQRAGINPTDQKEVLVVNQDDGSVMEGTTTTPYFWRDGKWVTPPVSAKFSWETGSGGQDGISRRWALERGLATEQVISAASLMDGEECWISNGVRGFFSAVVRLGEKGKE